jgi:hypothetical protein
MKQHIRPVSGSFLQKKSSANSPKTSRWVTAENCELMAHSMRIALGAAVGITDDVGLLLSLAPSGKANAGDRGEAVPRRLSNGSWTLTIFWWMAISSLLFLLVLAATVAM